MAIELRWLGHACFQVTCEDYSIVLDPFEPGSVPGCADIDIQADEVLCSHGHHDHNYTAGVRLPREKKESPFQVTVISTYHDDQEGALRGENKIHVLEAGGIKVAHFGDIGCELTLEQKKQLQGLDAAMLPVGGFYTVDAAGAWEIAEELRPTVIFPMHYRSETFGLKPISGVEEFLELCGKWVRYPGDTISITKGMERQTALLTYGAGR